MRKTSVLLGVLGMTLLFLSLGRTQITSDQWVPTYVTNQVDKALTPFSISVCTSVKYYNSTGTNDVPITSLKPGDAVIAIMDIPTSKVETNVGTYSLNIVGYTRFSIPQATNRSPVISGVRAI